MASTACRCTVSGTISLSCSEYFSPFPYGTGSLSVSDEYLALPDGTGRFTQDFSGPALLRIPLTRNNLYTYGAFTLYGSTFQKISLDVVYRMWSYNPRPTRRTIGLGFSLFARHYWGNHVYFLFHSGYLDVSVQEVGSPTCVGIIHLQCIRLSHSEIRGFNACMQLPSAYRSLPRPSSPIRSKASTIHPYSLSISSLNYLFVNK
jgi:hypothetical protein